MHLAMGVPLRVATATSNLMIGITAAASAVIYLIRGGIDPYVAGPTAIGVFLGATRRLAARPPGRPALPAPAVRGRPALHWPSRCSCRASRVSAASARPPGSRERLSGRLLIGVHLRLGRRCSSSASS